MIIFSPSVTRHQAEDLNGSMVFIIIIFFYLQNMSFMIRFYFNFSSYFHFLQLKPFLFSVRFCFVLLLFHV